MTLKLVKRYTVLGILFFLPVLFLLFLYPAKHHYNTLDLVKTDVLELIPFTTNTQKKPVLEGHLTILGFYGKKPLENLIAASNLKELAYDKFKGFKTFQVVILIPEAYKSEALQLKKEIASYETLDHWHMAFGSEKAIKKVYESLKSEKALDETLATNNVFLIDKERNQRGRIDDRTDAEKERLDENYSLLSYNCIEVAELKNKMSEDVRILFTEYRQKRKGDFDSNNRREDALKQ